MGFFKVSTEQDRVKDSTGGNYITKSGIYEVNLKHVLVNVSPNGSQSIDLNLDYNGQNQTIWGAIRLTNNDGKENFEAVNFNKLCIVTGHADGEEIADPVEVNLPIGKAGEMKNCLELEQFRDNPVFVRVQMEYQVYNDEIRESKRIKNFFRFTDKATAQEIVNNINIGNQFIEEEKIADNVTYRDDLTEEDIKEWKKNRGKKEKDTTPSESNSFSKRRTFGKANPVPF